MMKIENSNCDRAETSSPFYYLNAECCCIKFQVVQ